MKIKVNKFIIFIFLVISGIYIIFFGLRISIYGGLYDIALSFIKFLSDILGISKGGFLELANTFLPLRFVPDDRMFGLSVLIIGILIILYGIIILINNYISLKSKFPKQSIVDFSKSLSNISHKVSIVILTIFLIISTTILFQGLEKPVSRLNSFKQCEVASNVSFYVNDGFKIEETLFAKNQNLKLFSYPFYQWSAAGLAKISGIDFVISSRLINIIMFVLTFYLFFYILSYLNVNRFVIINSLMIFSLSPLVLYYYRAVLPDPMAIWLSYLSLYYFIKYEDNKSKIDFLICILAGILATLIKSPIYLMIFVSITFVRFYRYKFPGMIKSDFIVYSIIILGTVIFYKYSVDFINNGASLPSSWMFSTLSERLSLKLYLHILLWFFAEISNPVISILFILGIISIFKKIKYLDNLGGIYFAGLFIGMIISMIIFFNVQGHDYYHLPYVMIVAYFSSYFLFNIIDTKNNVKLPNLFSRLNWFVLFFIMIAGLSALRMPLEADQAIINNGKFINQNTEKDSFVFYVTDENSQTWDPTFLFHSRRNGFNICLKNLNKKAYSMELKNKFSSHFHKFYIFIPKKLNYKYNQNLINTEIYKVSDTGTIMSLK